MEIENGYDISSQTIACIEGIINRVCEEYTQEDGENWLQALLITGGIIGGICLLTTISGAAKGFYKYYQRRDYKTIPDAKLNNIEAHSFIPIAMAERSSSYN